MKTLLNDWENVLANGRNELVFESRNKNYGAFALRQENHRQLFFALFCSASFFILLAFSPKIVNLLLGNHLQKEPVEWVNKQITLLPPIEKPIIIPPVAPTTPPVSQMLKFVEFKVLDTKIEEEEIINQKDIDVKTGDTKTDGKDNLDIEELDGNGHTNLIVEPKKEDNSVHISVERMPSFPGGEEAMLAFINEHIRFPQEEVAMNIHGTCYVSFVVEKDGSVSNIKIERPISDGPGYSAEAKRVISIMPTWKPGQQNGIPVRVQFVLPIRFSVQ